VSDSPSNVLSKNLKAILLRHGWSQTDFARKLGVSHAFVSKLLHADTWVSSEILHAISRVCGLSYSEILGESEEDTKNLKAERVISVNEAIKVINAYEGQLIIKQKKLSKVKK
jgi:transcriptional regulator with XRE-family HTH domain